MTTMTRQSGQTDRTSAPQECIFRLPQRENARHDLIDPVAYMHTPPQLQERRAVLGIVIIKVWGRGVECMRARRLMRFQAVKRDSGVPFTYKSNQFLFER